MSITTTYALGAGFILAGAGLSIARAVAWRRAARVAPLAIEAGYRESRHTAGYAAGVSGAVTIIEGECRQPNYLDACAQVIYVDPDAEYHGLDRDNEQDADAWIASLERAGYIVSSAQVALDEAYARVLREEFEAFDRATSAAYEKVLAVGSREIVEWANDWALYKEAHGVEVATIEIHGIREWIENELAGNVAAAIVAEMSDGELDAEAATLADTPH